ncbi:MAG: ATP-binding protein [Bacteroidia bacterium]|nr:ATP-binding protein [Bacteroidia bacterium]
MFFDRAYALQKLISKKRVLLIYGPRRVGKTTLVKHFIKQSKLRCKYDSGDFVHTRLLFEEADFRKLKEYMEGYDLLFLDEAQQIRNIGQALKLMVDEMSVYVIASGSSSFDLRHQAGEPLTGRKRTLLLYPMSLMELRKKYNPHELREKLPDLMTYGMYPEVLVAASKKEKMMILNEMVDSYLLKDVFALERIKSPAHFVDLLRLLALQVGHEVSLHELSRQIHVDVKTVGRYLDLLEKAFVIKKVGGFSSNLRNEITAKAKYYFLDTGIRNALIASFQPLNQRSDAGTLFENFVFSEKWKQITYKESPATLYFWRTHQQQEIDMIVKTGTKIRAVEIKLNPKNRKSGALKAFKEAYKNAETSIVHMENLLSFVV